jgi:hypothetical protein
LLTDVYTIGSTPGLSVLLWFHFWIELDNWSILRPSADVDNNPYGEIYDLKDLLRSCSLTSTPSVLLLDYRFYSGFASGLNLTIGASSDQGRCSIQVPTPSKGSSRVCDVNFPEITLCVPSYEEYVICRGGTLEFLHSEQKHLSEEKCHERDTVTESPLLSPLPSWTRHTSLDTRPYCEPRSPLQYPCPVLGTRVERHLHFGGRWNCS